MEIELLEGPTTELTLPERALLSLGEIANEKALRELAAAHRDIIAVSNVDGRTQVHQAAMVLLKKRTGLDAAEKLALEDSKAFEKAVKEKKKFLVGLIEPDEKRLFALRDGFDADEAERKQAKIKAERERVDAIKAAIARIANYPLSVAGKPSGSIRCELEGLKIAQMPESVFQELLPEAEAAKARSIEAMGKMLNDALAKEEAELKAQQEREAEAARLVAERAENERVREELKAQRIEQERIAAEAAKKAATELKAAQEAQAAELAKERAEQARLQAIRDAELETRLAQQHAEHEANQEALRLELAEVARERAEIAEAQRVRDAADAAERERIAQVEAKAIEDALVDAIHATDDLKELTDTADELSALKTWPESIYLQNGDDVFSIPNYDEATCGDVSWHSIKIFDFDVQYIRADIVTKQLADMLAEINEINKIG